MLQVQQICNLVIAHHEISLKTTYIHVLHDTTRLPAALFRYKFQFSLENDQRAKRKLLSHAEFFSKSLCCHSFLMICERFCRQDHLLCTDLPEIIND